MNSNDNTPDTMWAVVTHGPMDYRLEQVPVPVPKEREILLRIEACGICAGDLKAFQGGKRFWGGGQFTQYVENGCIGGHEFIGKVAQLGNAIEKSFSIGERLIAEQIVPCGECAYCRRGKYWLCEPHAVFGFKTYLNGGFAEYMILPEKALIHKVPGDIPLEKATLIEPLACSLHAIDRSRLEPDDVVVLAGCGPLGLGMLAWMKAKYHVKVIALDMRAHRLQTARSLGADYVMDPKKDDVMQLVHSLSAGIGCDVYIEATGHPDSVPQGLEYIRKGGRFIEFSVFNDDVTCDFSIIGDAKEIDMHGVSLSPYCYERVIRALADGSLHVDGIVSHSYNLKAFAEGFKTAQADSKAIKVILVP